MSCPAPAAPRRPDDTAHAVRRVLFALGLIDTERFAVVVSDLSMPDVDGVAVLERARERQPEAVRIVLSGGSGYGATLEGRDRRRLRPPRLLHEEGWRRAAGGVIALPSCPRLYTELTELILNPRRPPRTPPCSWSATSR